MSSSELTNSLHRQQTDHPEAVRGHVDHRASNNTLGGRLTYPVAAMASFDDPGEPPASVDNNQANKRRISFSDHYPVVSYHVNRDQGRNDRQMSNQYYRQSEPSRSFRSYQGTASYQKASAEKRLATSGRGLHSGQEASTKLTTKSGAPVPSKMYPPAKRGPVGSGPAAAQSSYPDYEVTTGHSSTSFLDQINPQIEETGHREHFERRISQQLATSQMNDFHSHEQLGYPSYQLGFPAHPQLPAEPLGALGPQEQLQQQQLRGPIGYPVTNMQQAQMFEGNRVGSGHQYFGGFYVSLICSLFRSALLFAIKAPSQSPASARIRSLPSPRPSVLR